MTGVSTYGQGLYQTARIKEQQSLFSLLNSQLTTGKKTQKFTGLENDVLTSKRARSDLNTLDTYINNIRYAHIRINQTLQAVHTFRAQAQKFLDELDGLSQESVHQEGDAVFYDDPATTTVEHEQLGQTSGEPDGVLENLQRQAGKIYDFLIDLVNTQEEDRYLFAGAETATKPLNDRGTLDSALNKLFSDWKAGTITTDDFIADLTDRESSTGNPDAITDTIIGYSSTLSAGNAGKVFVRVADDTEIEYTSLGNDPAFRDIILAAAYMKNANLGPITDVYEPPNEPPLPPDVEGAPGDNTDEQKENFYAVYNAVRTATANAVQRLQDLVFDLETTRVRTSTLNDNYKNDRTMLVNTISDVEDADTTEVAVKLNTLQTQLEASFRVTARMQELSLVFFIN
ncbi:MAG: hypothetical protein L6Q57_01960 [Alphaproteobacteria bacterium]|nr:hypothetical protein [Alphaproteobacteria bacterium]